MLHSALQGTGTVQGGGSTGPVSPLAGAVRGTGQYATFTGRGTGQGTGQATGHFVAAPAHGGGSAIPERPPPGTYDPALDAQEGQAVRGYGDLVSDTQRNRRYTSEDYQRAVGDVNYNAGNQLGDLAKSGLRETQDYGFGQQYRTEDFNAATGERQRQYGLLGQRQGSEITASGLSGSGAGVLAARIRAANQGREQGLAATDYNRASGQAAIGHWRALQDNATDTGRVQHAQTKSLGDLGIQVGRTRQGYTTTLGRASRELNQFKVDTNRSRFYEARSNQRWKPKKSLVKALKAKGLIY